MKVWVIRDLEPLPVDSGNPRLMRAGMLCKSLADHGHETIWFTSDFNHYQHSFRATLNERFIFSKKLSLQIIPGRGYRRNISIQRVWHNSHFAVAFWKLANSKKLELPDVIMVDIPTTEAAMAAVRFAKKHNIPTVVSIRDIWPDSFPRYVHSSLRLVTKLLTYPLDKQVKYACTNGTSLVGTSEEYLQWGLRKGKRKISEKDLVVPLSNDPVKISDEEITQTRKRWGLEEQYRIVTFVGAWGKSLDFRLLKEMVQSFNQRSDVKFVIAGDGSGDGSQNLLIQALFELPNTVFPGWLNEREMAILLNITDIGLLPYMKNAPQTIPNKVYDYMSYGVFQISTLSGSVEKMYNETGCGQSVQPTSQALTAAVQQYLNNPSSNSRQKISEKFSDNFHAKEVYKELVSHVEYIGGHKVNGAL